LRFYLDASVLVAAVTNEPHSAAAQDWLEAQPSKEISFSGWTLTEVASALSVKHRRGDISALDKARADNAINAMVTSFERTPVEDQHFLAALSFVEVEQAKLRAGDALHAAIAADYDQTLVTLDRGLASGCAVLRLNILLLSGADAQ
jgi:predicted nucleic acid-binding protein